MSDEAIFLQALRDRPDDDTSRLVYADWLEEQADDPSRLRARFLRLEVELARLPEGDPQRLPCEMELRYVAARLAPGWAVLVSKRRLENCQLRFQFRCPQRWDALQPTEQGPDVRHCPECDRPVFYCLSLDVARRNALQGRCVALDPRVERVPGDLDPVAEEIHMGEIALDPPAVVDRVGLLDYSAFTPPPPPAAPRRSWWRRLFGG